MANGANYKASVSGSCNFKLVVIFDFYQTKKYKILSECQDGVFEILVKILMDLTNEDERMW